MPTGLKKKKENTGMFICWMKNKKTKNLKKQKKTGLLLHKTAVYLDH